MNRSIRWISVLAAVYFSIWLLFGSAVGYLQPQDEGTAVLSTFDADGVAHQTVVRPVVDEQGQIWILSGQWFRSWYNRALSNPNVQLQHSEVSTAYVATPIDDSDQIERVLGRRGADVNPIGALLYRSLFLFAPIKVLKLEPAP